MCQQAGSARGGDTGVPQPSNGDHIMRAQDLLPDHIDGGDFNGVVVRKGTVGAFLHNARSYLAPDTPPADRAVAEAHMAEALPAMRALGIFDVFEVADERLRAFVARRLAA